MAPVSRWTLCVVACAALAAIAWAYWPGLAGPFLFDDYGNLDVLGAYGPLDDWTSFLYYMTSGGADPTGRPVSLLTFLIDAQDWPADPWPFKRTNLVLHLLNTALLALVISRLQAGLQRRRPQLPASTWAPLLAATLWGAHPFFASTTLYVVQREAMLPMTFVLLALLVWDRAVLRFACNKPLAGWLWAILGIGITTLLAGLSKANGFLAPLLTGLAYLWFLRPADSTSTRRPMDFAAVLCLGLPSLLLLGYLFHAGWQSWALPHLHGRDWTIPERLLSEPRALWGYVLRLALPRAGGGGVYVEGFTASRGWMDPATTLPAVMALLASVIAAIALRRRFPIASFAWLFFLAGHLLESSVIALELYFEHRNYLPAMFLGWPIAHLLLRPGAYPRYRASFAMLLVAALLLLTHQRAVVWGNPALLTALSAAHEEDSARSQVAAARQQIDRGNTRAGLARIHALQIADPDSVDVAINAVGMECATTGSVAADTLMRTRQTLATARNWNYGLYVWMQDAARTPGLRHCRGFGLDGLRALVTAAEANPQSAPPRRKRELWHVRGRIALASDRPTLALHWFDKALLLHPDPEYALVQAAALGNAGAPALGLKHLDRYRHQEAAEDMTVRDMAGLHRWLLKHYGYYRDEMNYLRKQLQRDAAGAAPQGE